MGPSLPSTLSLRRVEGVLGAALAFTVALALVGALGACSSRPAADGSFKVTVVRPKMAEAPTDIHLGAVDFVDATHGWSIGGGGWRWPVLLRTTDGWTWKALRLPGYGHPVALEFIDSRQGWIVVSLSAASAEGPGVAILRTADGGLTWRAARNSSMRSPGERGSLFFRDASHGWVVGATPGDLRIPVVLRTDDGGVTWRQVPVTDQFVTLTSVAFADAGRGWISGYDNQHTGTPGAAFRTGDGGRTWQPVDAARAPHSDLFRLDAAHLWSLGEYPQLLRLSAKGTDWEPVGSPAGAPGLFSFATASVGWGIHFDTEEEGVVVGWQLLRTADGGRTWADCRVALPDQPADMACPMADSVVIVSIAGTITTVSK